MIDNWIIRIILFPFTILYWIIIQIRNLLYETGLLRSVSFDVPVISVGNLNTGGTGKTPMIEYLIRQLQPFIQVGVLSRGYKRKTKGYRNVQPQDPYTKVGDEPLQIKKKYPAAAVAVGEDRSLAIPQLLQNYEDVQLVLLDDAFQHRAVTPYFHILLTEYGNLFTRDYLLPMGRLREPRRNAARADIVVVTKCPSDLSEDEKKKIREEIKPASDQHLFFSTLRYHTAYNVFDTTERVLPDGKTIFLLTGIANPDSIARFVKKRSRDYFHRRFPDHYAFRKHDVANVIDTYEKMEGEDKMFLTTEKDLIRLEPHFHYFMRKDIDLFALPIEVEFLDDEQGGFTDLVKDKLLKFKV